MNFEQWGKGKPDGDGNYVFTRPDEYGSVYWDDISAGYEIGFICEY